MESPNCILKSFWWFISKLNIVCNNPKPIWIFEFGPRKTSVSGLCCNNTENLIYFPFSLKDPMIPCWSQWLSDVYRGIFYCLLHAEVEHYTAIRPLRKWCIYYNMVKHSQKFVCEIQISQAAGSKLDFIGCVTQSCDGDFC